MKRLNKKGFTMAELLIVVAIIAVLVAIAIPVFTRQLEKSRDSVTVANLRAAYAQAMTDMLTNDTYTSTQKVACKGTATDTNLSGLAGQLPFKDAATNGAIATIAGYDSAQEVDVTFTIEKPGTATEQVVASVN